MKNIVWVVLAMLAVSVVVAEMRCGSHDEVLLAEEIEDSLSGSGEVDDEDEEVEYEYVPYMDTVLMVEGKALGFMETEDYNKCVVAYDLHTIMDDPTASFDSISPVLYAVDLVGRRQVFNVSKASCIYRIMSFNCPITGFKRYDRKIDVAEDSSQTMPYYFTLDYPDDTVAGRDEIAKWLVGLVDGSQVMDVESKSYISLYTGYHPTRDYGTRYKDDPNVLDKLSDYAAKMWWVNMKVEFEGYLPFSLYFISDYRARICNERFVTYRKYEHSYMGGAHGMYMENLVSYDRVNHCPVSNDYLFKADAMDEVQKLLFDAIAHDEKFRAWNRGVETAEDAKKRIEVWNDAVMFDDTTTFRLPEAGLTDEGVLFSFQPYEIDCFAAGCFHILVPYHKVKPYLNKQVVSMLGI